MGEATFCWWCKGPLVGPGGVAGRQPLFFREVKTPDGEVRVHVKCKPDALYYLRPFTAQPPSGGTS